MTYLSPYPSGMALADLDDAYDAYYDGMEEGDEDDYEGEDITDLAALIP